MPDFSVPAPAAVDLHTHRHTFHHVSSSIGTYQAAVADMSTHTPIMRRRSLSSSSGSNSHVNKEERAEAFRREHELKFAHLHIDDGVREAAERLRREEELLEQERRQGKERRKLWENTGRVPDTARRLSAGSSTASRPLSLTAHKRESFGPALERRASDAASLPLRPLSLMSSSSAGRGKQRRIVSDTTRHSATHNRLEVLREATATPPFNLDSRSSSPQRVIDASLNQSTYSWASTFSGETAELRTAAHYVKASGDSPEDEDVLVSTPEKQNHRRKKIVAIAHTVRQLEGVGSREAEDPTMYETIRKAWRGDDAHVAVPKTNNGRRDSALTAAPPQGLFGTVYPGRLPPPTPMQLQLPEPSPEAAQTQWAFYDYGAQGAYGYGQALTSPPALMASPPDFQSAVPYHFSPADANIHTPAFPSDGFPMINHNEYPSVPYYTYEEDQPRQTAEGEDSLSLRGSSRFSYASTLHDLALDGAIRHGAELMSEKAWMRSSNAGPSHASGSTGWDAFHAAPPAFFGAQDYRPPSIHSTPYTPDLGGRTTPERPLRKYKGTIGRPAQADADGQAVPAASGSGEGGGWGLGFVSDWFGKPAALRPDQEADEAGASQQDFHQGEEAIRTDLETGTRGSSLYGDGPESRAVPEAELQTLSATPTVDDEEVGVAITTSEEAYPVALEVAYRPNGLHVDVMTPPPLTRLPPPPAPAAAAAPTTAQIPIEYMLYHETTGAPGVASGSRSSNPYRLPISSTPSTTFYPPLVRQDDSVSADRAQPTSKPLPPAPGQDPTAAMGAAAAAASYPTLGIGSSQSEGQIHRLPKRTTSLKKQTQTQMRRFSMPRFPLIHPDAEEILTCHRAETAAQSPQYPGLESRKTSPAVAESITLPAPSPASRPSRPSHPRHQRSNSSPPSSSDASSSPRWWSILPRNHRPASVHQGIADRRIRPADGGSVLSGTRAPSLLPDTECPAGSVPPRPPQSGIPSAPRLATSSGTLGAATTPSTTTKPEPMVASRVQRKPSSTSRTLFYLGFLMPFIWIFAGWIPAVTPTSDTEADAELKAASRIHGGSTLDRMMYHPDKYVRWSRIASTTIIPTLFVLAITAIVVLVILR